MVFIGFMLVFNEILVEKAGTVTTLTNAYGQNSGGGGQGALGRRSDTSDLLSRLQLYQQAPSGPYPVNSLAKQPPFNHPTYHMGGVALTCQIFNQYFSLMVIPLYLLLISLPIEEKECGVSSHWSPLNSNPHSILMMVIHCLC